MATQYVKLYAWMTELGLSAAEMIVYALVSAYTGFKGSFDGSRAWLSKWIGSSVGETSEVLESLSAKGLIYPSGKRGGVEYFKSTTLIGGSRPSKAPKPGITYIDNNIDNNIEHSIEDPIEHPIEKKNNKDPIENPIEHPIERSFDPLSIEDPIVYAKKPRARTDGPEPIGSLIGELLNAEPPSPSGTERAESRPERPRVKALLEEYGGDITAIPLEKLAAAMREPVA